MEKPKLVQGEVKTVTATPDAKKVEAQAKETKTKDRISDKTESPLPTQREAVYLEVMRLVRDEKIVVADKQPMKPLLNETHIKKICLALVNGFQAKKIALKDTESNKKKLADAKAMELYCLGLLNNWLRRDKRLNGAEIQK